MSAVPGFTAAALNRARLSRDARFDGKFFIAVLSTGVYCRPICPGPRCKRSNVAFYPTAAAAQAAGYRPCRRCRPEAAPGSPAWLGASAVVRRGLRLIEAGTLDDATVEALATRVGVGARHLRRLFVEHVGVSPIAIAITRRLQFAKQLIVETELPITHVAMASGFRSLRRFNEAYRETFRCSPRETRHLPQPGLRPDTADLVALTLPYQPPYDWYSLWAFLKRRELSGVERVDARGYARTLRLPRGHAFIRVAPIEGVNALRLEVSGAPPSCLFEIAMTARRVFDLGADPVQIAAALGGDRWLSNRVRRQPGIRIAGTWDAFECAVRAALGENVDRAPQRALERLAERYGEPLDEPFDRLTRIFPSAEQLAHADLTDLRLTRASTAGLRAVARAALEGMWDFTLSTDTVKRAFEALPGCGREAAQYTILRGLGEPDAFPLSDRAVRQLLEVPELLDAREARITGETIEQHTESWRPWRGYAAFCLCEETSAKLARTGAARGVSRRLPRQATTSGCDRDPPYQVRRSTSATEIDR